MFELDVIKRIQVAQEQIAKGNHREAIGQVDDLAQWYAQRKRTMSTSERLEFAGGIADMYSRLDEFTKEVPFWEELCGLADSDLAELGIMASAEDILRTGFDFLRLGRAYRRQGRTFNAKRAFERAAEILEGLKIKPDLQALLMSDGQVTVGEYRGQRLFVT